MRRSRAMTRAGWVGAGGVALAAGVGLAAGGGGQEFLDEALEALDGAVEVVPDQRGERVWPLSMARSGHRIASRCSKRELEY